MKEILDALTLRQVMNILSGRLETQAVEIAKLKSDLETQTARSTKLRKWWDDETERADRLEVQSGQQDTEINNLKREKESWEYERATLLGQVKDLKAKLMAKMPPSKPYEHDSYDEADNKGVDYPTDQNE